MRARFPGREASTIPEQSVKMVVNILLKPQERGPSTTVISIKAQLREIAMICGSL